MKHKQTKEKPMQEFHFMFETDYGMEMGKIIVEYGLPEAMKLLKQEFPNDIGADGCWTNQNGDEFPINW